MMKAVTQAKANANEAKRDKLARESEQRRAEAAQLEETQALLRAETLRRIRRFGQLSGAATSIPGFLGGAGMGGLLGGGSVSSGLDGALGGIRGGLQGLQIGTA